jgi:hypothetical protein
LHQSGHSYIFIGNTPYALTPDSMQRLTLRMFEMMELPMGGDHDF